MTGHEQSLQKGDACVLSADSAVTRTRTHDLEWRARTRTQ